MKPIKIFCINILVIALLSCNSHTKQETAAENVISDSIMKTLQVATAASEDVEDVIKLNGKIQADESKQAKVYALVSGKIKDVKVELGDFVRRGQVLAVIQSTEVANVSNDVNLAQQNVALAKKTLETQQDLYQGKLATEQDYINAKISYNKALAELNRSRQVSAITGGRSSTYTVTAPLSGYIIEKNITNNSEVRSDNSTNLFAIADLSTVWVIANVYEADINNIHLGDEVKVNTLADPNKDYVGKIDKIYNVLDPATRTMKVRISMANRNNELKPEMFATVKVNGRPSQSNVVAIPSSAIVLDNSKNYLVIKKGNQLQTREIRIIKRVDPKAYVAGVLPGEEVVTNSQIFLYQALTNK
jgi:membrane fusion protein, heavy metal efflux system